MVTSASSKAPGSSRALMPGRLFSVYTCFLSNLIQAQGLHTVGLYPWCLSYPWPSPLSRTPACYTLPRGGPRLQQPATSWQRATTCGRAYLSGLLLSWDYPHHPASGTGHGVRPSNPAAPSGPQQPLPRQCLGYFLIAVQSRLTRQS